MSEKQLIVIGGPNGAGKSTFALEYVAEFDYPFFSADAIAKELMPQFPTHAQIAAGREFLRRVTGAVAGSQSLIVESTLSGLSLKRFAAERPRDRFLDHYSLSISRGARDVHCSCSRTDAIGRAESDIRRRFGRSNRNFWNLYRFLADDWFLIYNSGNRPLDVAVGRDADFSVRDTDSFALFHELATAEE